MTCSNFLSYSRSLPSLSAALCWCFYALCKHPDVEQRLYAELCEAFGPGRLSAADVTWEKVKPLSYLHAVVKEVLRLYPPAPVIVREAAQQTQLPTMSGATVTVPQGTTVSASIYAMHHLPQYWGEDVEEFLPHRWLEPRITQDRARYSKEVLSFRYLPFIAGERSCIGNNFALMEIKVRQQWF